MEERNLLRIAKHLQDESAQRRIQQNIQRGRNEVTVTIGRAARLFGFSESQLRDWEKMGLIKPIRPQEVTESKHITGQRQYSFSELDKLAIIRELIDEARLTPGSIPPNIDEIWYALQLRSATPPGANGHSSSEEQNAQVRAREHINKRITENYRELLGWRFYCSRVLWLALMLIYEEVPGFYAGLILPAYEQGPEKLHTDGTPPQAIGEALVGWQGQTRSFFTFLTPEPQFEYPSDYLMLPLCPTTLQGKLPVSQASRTWVVVQRDEIQHVHLNEKAVRTVLRLLEPIYEHRQHWHHYIGHGMQDQADPGMDFTPKIADAVLTHLAETIIRLGGKNKAGDDNWHSCCILLPGSQNLPLQQQSLIVRAKSARAPHVVGLTTVAPEQHSNSLSLRAFHSSHLIYRTELAHEDTMTLYRELEGPIRSNIAIPIGGETGQPLGIIYINSFELGAFPEENQRILRIMSKIVEELLSIYYLRQRIATHVTDLLEDPTIVDPFFKEFPAENQFLQDIETLLVPVREQMLHHQQKITLYPRDEKIKEISFIALDIDSDVQETVANSYGDRTLHNLNKAVGLRVRDLLPALFTDYLNCRLYHMYAGRYYLFLRGFPLEKTKNNAERLRKALEGNIAIKQSDLPGGTLTLPQLSVHLGVTWYSAEKIQDFLDPIQERALTDISATIYHSLDFVLKLGTGLKGGNIVYAWDPAIQTFSPYIPEEEKK